MPNTTQTLFRQDCFCTKSFLVSGASSGIGAHIALELNKLGAKILAIGRDIQKLEKKRESARDKTRFIPIVQDISEYTGLDKWALNLAKEYGSLDGAVLSAGIRHKHF